MPVWAEYLMFIFSVVIGILTTNGWDWAKFRSVALAKLPSWLQQLIVPTLSFLLVQLTQHGLVLTTTDPSLLTGVDFNAMFAAVLAFILKGHANQAELKAGMRAVVSKNP